MLYVSVGLTWFQYMGSPEPRKRNRIKSAPRLFCVRFPRPRLSNHFLIGSRDESHKNTANLMKKILLIVLATIILPHTAIAADGDVFTATVSGTPMSFKVISEAAKTCQVGEGSSTPCIGKSYSGAIDLPSEVNGYIVKSIADKAFSRCSLRSVTIPESVTTIGEYAFDNCSGLTCVNITDLAAWCKISFGSDSSNPLRYAHHLYMDGEEITNLVIPEGVTTIGDYAFRGCSGLTSVTIPESVTRIGDTAFYGCI